MHWFWRGLIAMAATMAGSLLASVVLWKPIDTAYWAAVLYINQKTGNAVVADAVASIVLFELPVMGAALALFCLLSKRLGPNPEKTETHCRKCSYILRGLTEPRCPECGEAI